MEQRKRRTRARSQPNTRSVFCIFDTVLSRLGTNWYSTSKQISNVGKDLAPYQLFQNAYDFDIQFEILKLLSEKDDLIKENEVLKRYRLTCMKLQKENSQLRERLEQLQVVPSLNNKYEVLLDAHQKVWDVSFLDTACRICSKLPSLYNFKVSFLKKYKQIYILIHIS